MAEEFDALGAARNDKEVPVETVPSEEVKETVQTTEDVSQGGEQEAQSAEGVRPETEVVENQDKQRWVPLPHLIQERQKRRELDDELKSLRAQIDELKAVKPPDYDEDPQAHIDTRFQQLEEKISKQPTPDQVQEQVQNTQLMAALQGDYDRVTKEIPDFAQALEHTRQVYANGHLYSGAAKTMEEAMQMVYEGELNLAKNIMLQGRSPHEMIYEYAKTNLGYKPPKKEDTSRIDAIKKGQQASPPAGQGDAVPETTQDADAFDEAMAEAFEHMRK